MELSTYKSEKTAKRRGCERMVCPKCAHPNAVQHESCERCGTPLSQQGGTNKAKDPMRGTMELSFVAGEATSSAMVINAADGAADAVALEDANTFRDGATTAISFLEPSPQAPQAPAAVSPNPAAATTGPVVAPNQAAPPPTQRPAPPPTIQTAPMPHMQMVPTGQSPIPQPPQGVPPGFVQPALMPGMAPPVGGLPPLSRTPLPGPMPAPSRFVPQSPSFAALPALQPMPPVGAPIGSPTGAMAPFPTLAQPVNAYSLAQSPIGQQVAAPSANDPLLGNQIGNYLIQKKIGKGGFGSVYLAKHIFIHQNVAIKVLHVDRQTEPEIIERFKREAHTLAQMRHPGIVQLTDFGMIPNQGFYLAMEYLEGRNLGTILRKKYRFSLPQILCMYEQLCDVLQYVHTMGIVHRDLKPGNIFILKNSPEEAPQIRLIDFGIATLNQELGSLTGTGTYLGTAKYISPEQGRGDRQLDGRADLYSAGVLLYRLLTGHLPFDGEQPITVLYNQIHAPPPALSALSPEQKWHPELEAFVQKAMAKVPEERPQDGRTFFEGLKAAVEAQLSTATLSGATIQRGNPTQAPPVQAPQPTQAPQPAAQATLQVPQSPQPTVQATQATPTAPVNGAKTTAALGSTGAAAVQLAAPPAAITGPQTVSSPPIQSTEETSKAATQPPTDTVATQSPVSASPPTIASPDAQQNETVEENNPATQQTENTNKSAELAALPPDQDNAPTGTAVESKTQNAEGETSLAATVSTQAPPEVRQQADNATTAIAGPPPTLAHVDEGQQTIATTVPPTAHDKQETNAPTGLPTAEQEPVQGAPPTLQTPPASQPKPLQPPKANMPQAVATPLPTGEAAQGPQIQIPPAPLNPQGLPQKLSPPQSTDHKRKAGDFPLPVGASLALTSEEPATTTPFAHAETPAQTSADPFGEFSDWGKDSLAPQHSMEDDDIDLPPNNSKKILLGFGFLLVLAGLLWWSMDNESIETPKTNKASQAKGTNKTPQRRKATPRTTATETPSEPFTAKDAGIATPPEPPPRPLAPPRNDVAPRQKAPKRKAAIPKRRTRPRKRRRLRRKRRKPPRRTRKPPTRDRDPYGFNPFKQ